MVIEAITTVAQKDGDKGRGKIFIIQIESGVDVNLFDRFKEFNHGGIPLSLRYQV